MTPPRGVVRGGFGESPPDVRDRPAMARTLRLEAARPAASRSRPARTFGLFLAHLRPPRSPNPRGGPSQGRRQAENGRKRVLRRGSRLGAGVRPRTPEVLRHGERPSRLLLQLRGRNLLGRPSVSMMIPLADTAGHPYFPPVDVAEATEPPVWAEGHAARGKRPRGSAHYTRGRPARPSLTQTGRAARGRGPWPS